MVAKPIVSYSMTTAHNERLYCLHLAPYRILSPRLEGFTVYLTPSDRLYQPKYR